MALLLGIDPGSRRTGYGLVEQVGNRSRAVAFGTIATTHKEIPRAWARSLPAFIRW